jgi:hypothetical protein
VADADNWASGPILCNSAFAETCWQWRRSINYDISAMTAKTAKPITEKTILMPIEGLIYLLNQAGTPLLEANQTSATLCGDLGLPDSSGLPRERRDA